MRTLQSAHGRADALKRQLTAACEEVGLIVSHARAIPLASDAGWLVGAFASRPDWNRQDPMIILAATVTVDGLWPRIVHIWSGLWTDQGRMMMNGREQIRLHDLVCELMSTLDEFQAVESAIQAGTSGPYWFGSSLWLEQ